MSITIQEARQKKSNAEAEVMAILVRFAEETGLNVEGVRFEMHLSGLEGEKKAHCTSLAIDVRFDEWL